MIEKFLRGQWMNRALQNSHACIIFALFSLPWLKRQLLEALFQMTPNCTESVYNCPLGKNIWGKNGPTERCNSFATLPNNCQQYKDCDIFP